MAPKVNGLGSDLITIAPLLAVVVVVVEAPAFSCKTPPFDNWASWLEVKIKGAFVVVSAIEEKAWMC